MDISVLFLLCFRLFIDDLWSPAVKGPTLALVCDVKL